jgi:hypothetical protein
LALAGRPPTRPGAGHFFDNLAPREIEPQDRHSNGHAKIGAADLPNNSVIVSS